MTILFSNPPWWTIGANNTLRGGIRAGSRWPFTRPSPYGPEQFAFGSYMPFPFFLAHAAAHVAQRFREAKVILRDSIARGESYPGFLTAVSRLAPDLLVIESGSASLSHDLELIGFLKSKHPEIRVALAGPVAAEAHAAAAKSGSIAISGFLQGEYEKSSERFVRDFAGAETATAAPKLYERDLLTTDEMNALPVPMFDEVAALHYWDACPVGQKPPHLQLWTSRGCPYKCVFCVWPAVMTGDDPDGTKPRSVRFHSAEWVESYLTEMLARYPYETIYFDDDTFNLNDRHVLGICEVMSRIKRPWSAMCRADTIKQETWLAMKHSGCFGVKIGFESGSQHVVDSIINKRLNLEEAAETARWLRSIGMTVHGTFTVGLPGETAEEADQTVEFIKTLYRSGALDTHQLSGTAEISGTPLATIHDKGELAKYPAAKIDSAYIASPDGQLKSETL